MANSGAGVYGDEREQRAPPNSDVVKPPSSAARGPTGAEALSQAVATFEEALLVPVTPENQE